VVQSHLQMRASITWTAVWLAERSPFASFLATRWSHFRRWKLAFHFSRLVLFLALH
jgi:hypothetical protein